MKNKKLQQKNLRLKAKNHQRKKRTRKNLKKKRRINPKKRKKSLRDLQRRMPSKMMLKSYLIKSQRKRRNLSRS